jgi:hypothetical protein
MKGVTVALALRIIALASARTRGQRRAERRDESKRGEGQGRRRPSRRTGISEYQTHRIPVPATVTHVGECASKDLRYVRSRPRDPVTCQPQFPPRSHCSTECAFSPRLRHWHPSCRYSPPCRYTLCLPTVLSAVQRSGTGSNVFDHPKLRVERSPAPFAAVFASASHSAKLRPPPWAVCAQALSARAPGAPERCNNIVSAERSML